jgi:hypothetical protein
MAKFAVDSRKIVRYSEEENLTTDDTDNTDLRRSEGQGKATAD